MHSQKPQVVKVPFPYLVGSQGAWGGGLRVWQGTQSLSVCLGVDESGNMLDAMAPRARELFLAQGLGAT